MYVVCPCILRNHYVGETKYLTLVLYIFHCLVHLRIYQLQSIQYRIVLNNYWAVLNESLHKLYKVNHEYGTVQQQSGAVEACWAHNPEVRGSKPRSARFFSSFFSYLCQSNYKCHECVLR